MKSKWNFAFAQSWFAGFCACMINCSQLPVRWHHTGVACAGAQANENDSMGGNRAASAFKVASGKSRGNVRRDHSAQEERDHVRLQKERIRRLEADVGVKDRRIRELEQQSMVSLKLVAMHQTTGCRTSMAAMYCIVRQTA